MDVRPAGSRAWRRSLIIAVGALMALTAAGPASAYTVVKDEGSRGEFWFNETETTPLARCGYSDPNAAGDARFRWMRVLAPGIFAADRTTERDSRIVGWFFKLQRMMPTGPWQTIARSPEQKARAYDDAAAVLTAKKVYFKGKIDGSLFRAVVVMKWYKPNGSVAGKVVLRPSYYSVKWTVGTPDYVYIDACDSSAD